MAILPQPTILNPVTGVYFFVPSPTDIDGGRAFVIRSDSNGLLVPPQYNGTVGNLASGGGGGNPVIGSFAPALGTSIGKRVPISFTVSQGTGLLKRVVIAVSFPTLKTYEIAHDGDSFSALYPAALGNALNPNGGNPIYTLLRQNGWPASPRIIPMAFAADGGLNPITSVNYSWALGA